MMLCASSGMVGSIPMRFRQIQGSNAGCRKLRQPLTQPRDCKEDYAAAGDGPATAQEADVCRRAPAEPAADGDAAHRACPASVVGDRTAAPAVGDTTAALPASARPRGSA